MRTIGSSDLCVSPLCLGTNVFGWTITDERDAFAVLDAYVAAGGNFIDTADSYTAWVGSEGGESETMIGSWLAARGNRDDVVIATKVGKVPGLEGTAPATVRRAAEASLARLGTDRIDLYYAHLDDERTPLEDTLGAFGELVAEGKVRQIAASNFSAPRLAESLAVSRANGLPEYVAIQPEYNLMHRGDYEGALAELCGRENIGCVPYFALANGFLTGKYRVGGAEVSSQRAGGASAYLDERGTAVLAVLDELAAAYGTTVAAVALAWLAAQSTVVAPIASARTPAQLADLVGLADVPLDGDDLRRLATTAGV